MVSNNSELVFTSSNDTGIVHSSQSDQVQKDVVTTIAYSMSNLALFSTNETGNESLIVSSISTTPSTMFISSFVQQQHENLKSKSTLPYILLLNQNGDSTLKVQDHLMLKSLNQNMLNQMQQQHVVYPYVDMTGYLSCFSPDFLHTQRIQTDLGSYQITEHCDGVDANQVVSI